MKYMFCGFKTHWHYFAKLGLFVEFFGDYQLHPVFPTGRITYNLEGPMIFQGKPLGAQNAQFFIGQALEKLNKISYYSKRNQDS